MRIKKGDFIEIDYVGKVEGKIFDLTEEEVAKENNIFNKKTEYKPIIICIGENEIVKGLDEFLIEKELGEYEITLKPENAFGKKDPKLLKLVPAKTFLKQNINPMPGLQVNINGVFGIIRTVTGGRCIVDFNHPLAGREVYYKIKVNKIVNDDKEKVKSILRLYLNSEDAELKEGKAIISCGANEDVKKMVAEKIKKLLPDIKEVEFKKSKTDTIS